MNVCSYYKSEKENRLASGFFHRPDRPYLYRKVFLFEFMHADESRHGRHNRQKGEFPNPVIGRDVARSDEVFAENIDRFRVE